MFLRLLSLPLFAHLASAARYPSYGTLQTTNSSGIMNVVINNTYSSINLFDQYFQSDLANLIETLQANDSDIRVVVFSSANPEFFLSHVDFNLLTPGHGSSLPLFDTGFPSMLFASALLWNITELPQATIAVIEGRARGGGNEFLMSCDMRFSSTSPSVLLSQLETSLGVPPGFGGDMYLAKQIGRGRAFEYVLSAADIDARTAERVGWINRAFDTTEELYTYVQALANRIALFPPAGIVGVKQGINAVSRPSMDVIVQDSQDIVLRLAATSAVQDFLVKLNEATNNQSIGPFELNYGEEVLKLYE
ncbi:ClpP/crotonase-like domain-containing protein [Mycena galopus ATCC 62051]|nr:ClpP/crotonase-like domain-containing protein [Mycena galopus ATCC 62051]